jgi:glycosyltransferase involved in cell wall biosynthesis
MALKGDFVHWVTLFRLAKRIVFLTERQKDKTFASFTAGLDDRIVVAPCGAPADIGKLRVPAGKDYLGVVMHAPVLSHKRQQDLIAAGERLREYNLSFTFIGESQGFDTMPEGMRKIVTRNPERYQFVGYQTGAQTRDLLAKNDLYCHTSSDEAWPQSVIDAAGMGLPLMLSEIEAFSKLWVHGVNCLKFPTGNPDFLASSLRMLLQDDVLRNNLSAQSVNTSKRFSHDRFYGAMVQMVEGLVQ